MLCLKYICMVCRAATKDTGQEQLQKALQEKAQLQVTTQKLQAEVGYYSFPCHELRREA